MSVNLNKRLIKQQGLNTFEVRRLESLHAMLNTVLIDMEYFYNSEDKFELQEWVKIIKSIEFLMQAGWKFPVSEDYHSYWYRSPHCTCAVLDNDELMGLPYSYVTLSCPLHGETASKPEEPVEISKFYEFWYMLDDKRLEVVKFWKWVKNEWSRGF